VTWFSQATCVYCLSDTRHLWRSHPLRHTLTLILTHSPSLSRAVLFLQQTDECGLVSDAAALAEERTRAVVLEDTFAKERLLIGELAAAAAEKERSAAANTELKGALAEARAELEETRRMLVEALRYHYRTFQKRYVGHPTRMLDATVKSKAIYIIVKGFALYSHPLQRCRGINLR
jgi:hypothetical protein